MKIKSNQRGLNGSLPALPAVALLCLSALFAATFRAAPGKPQPESVAIVPALPSTTAPTPAPTCPAVITQSTSQSVSDPVFPCLRPPPHPIQLENHYWRAFNMQTFVGGTQYDVSSVSFGVNLETDDFQLVTVRLYTNNGAPFPGGTRNEIAAHTINVTTAQSGTIVTIPLAATVPAGTNELVMELHTAEAAGLFYAGANAAPETGLSYWGCENDPPQPINPHLVFNVYGSCPATPTPTPPTLIVISTADSGPGSLRQALADANDGDVIAFDPALNGQTVLLTSGELVIDKNISISGPGPNLLTVSRSSGTFRIFHIMPGHNVTIDGLKITNGLVLNGGGLLNDHATVTVSNCIVSGNAADNGGGILNDHGTVTIERSLVTGNGKGFPYGGNGGGICSLGDQGTAVLTITNSSINGNGGAAGGGIYNYAGTVSLSNSSVSNNSVYIYGTFSTCAGGIFNFGTLEITDSTISNNMTSALGDGGGVVSYGSFTLTNSIVAGNSAGYERGGGGGIVNGGSLTVNNCTLSSNQAPGARDGLWGYGGGIVNSGTLEIVSSALYNNGASASGGAIVSGGTSATLTISNSTFSGNGTYTSGGTHGGAISNSGPLEIAHSTFHDNASGTGGGIYNQSTFSIADTILNANTGGNIINNAGTVTSLGYNLSSDSGSGFLTAPGDLINTNPMLGPLQDNGGATLTHALYPGSSAINAGNPNFSPPPLYDQRGVGFDRVVSGRIDIGAFEEQSAQPVPTPTPTPSSTPSPPSAQLLNISTRLKVETGDGVMIAGFIVTGNEPKKMALRGLGTFFCFELPDCLMDPTLELRAANGSLLLQNDNWQDNPAQAAELIALDLDPQNPEESGIVVTLQPAAYTAILAGKNQTGGVGLIEVYDTNQAANARLANISTRGFVGTDYNVMVGGVILGGSSNNAGIAIRGIGPSLTQFGVSNVLADPTLELHGANGALMVTNDNWQDDPVSAAQLTAHGLAPSIPNESGIFISLQPGQYTAILIGKNGGTGVGLVEIYNVN